MSNLNITTNSSIKGYSTITNSCINALSLCESPKNNTSHDVPKPPDASTSRFFFSPTSTKSLLDETKQGTTISKEVTETKGAATASILMQSVKLSMTSKNPYGDFKKSMEEMVEHYRIRELPRLQELLHCYLKLNQRKDHEVIMFAFVDLFLDLMAQNKTTTLC